MDLNKLSLKQLKERIVYCKFLISEIEEITKDTSDVEKIKTQYIEHLKTLNEIVDIRNKEIQLIRGKKLLEWFGIVTVFIGISFLIVDYEIWKYFNLGLVKKFYQFIVNLPGIVKFIVTSIVVCFSYWGVYSQQNKSQNKSRQILFLATILLGVDLYMMPYWLFDKEMYQLSLFLISIVTIITSYMFSFKT